MEDREDLVKDMGMDMEAEVCSAPNEEQSGMNV